MRQMSPRMMEILGRLLNRAIEARNAGTCRPFVIANMITNRCMCHCRSCLWKNNERPDVPAADLKRFYAEAAREGFLATAMSGGEPFLRRDLGEIVKFIRDETPMAALVFTTGWFLEERMDEVLPYIDMMITSLDSASRERHDQIRGLPGLYDRLMRGVDLVRSKYPGVSLQFNTCVQKGIEEEIDDLLRLAADKGIQISFDVISEYRHGEGDSHFTETDMGLPLPELRGICAYLLEKKLEGAPILNSEHYFRYFVEGKPGYRCHLPKLALYCVNGSGDVEDCLNVSRPIANIREKSLKEILELPRFKQIRLDAEACCSCNSPTMVDSSFIWEDPARLFQPGGIMVS
jgi:MoaA/NifB/PqqE/SkfB family radical SAM enzyme